MDIKLAIKYIPDLKKVRKFISKRLFCNADETINTIADYCIEKQELHKPLNVTSDSIGVLTWTCVCGAKRKSRIRYRYCNYCGRRIDWSSWLQEKGEKDPEIIRRAECIFPELYGYEEDD